MAYGPAAIILVSVLHETFFPGRTAPPDEPKDDEEDQLRLVGFEAVALWGEKQT